MGGSPVPIWWLKFKRTSMRTRVIMFYQEGATSSRANSWRRQPKSQVLLRGSKNRGLTVASSSKLLLVII
jgi:hypothetical protein